MPRTDKLSNYRTNVATTNGSTSVVYVSTAIVEWDAKTIKLSSGGWESVTTKRKMNQASNQFGLGFSVSQRKKVWYVGLPNDGGEVPFVDGMRFAR